LVLELLKDLLHFNLNQTSGVDSYNVKCAHQAMHDAGCLILHGVNASIEHHKRTIAKRRYFKSFAIGQEIYKYNQLTNLKKT